MRRRARERNWSTMTETVWGKGGAERVYEKRRREGKTQLHPSLHPSTQAGIVPLLNLGIRSKADMDADKSSSEKLVLEFKEDTELTEVRFSLSDSFSKNYSKISSLEATDVCKTFILQTKKHFLDFHLMQLWRFRFSIESFPWYTAKTLNLFYFIFLPNYLWKYFSAL